MTFSRKIDAIRRTLKGIGKPKANKMRASGLKDVNHLAGLYKEGETASRADAMKFTGADDGWKALKIFESWLGKARDHMAKHQTTTDSAVVESDEELGGDEHMMGDFEPDDDGMEEDEQEEQEEDEVVVLPEDFPSFIDWNGGAFMSAEIADAIAWSYYSYNAPFYKSQMCGLTGKVLCFDQTFYVAKKITATAPDTHQRFRPVESLGSCMNEYGQIIWYAFLHQDENAEEYMEDLKEISKRCPDVQAIYIDNCCTLRNSFGKAFPNVPVCLDPWHWFPRWDHCIAVKTTDPKNYRFRAMLRRALLVIDSEDAAAAYKMFAEKGKSNPKYREVSQYCRNYILPPKITMPAIKAVLDELIAEDTEKRVRLAVLKMKEMGLGLTAEEVLEKKGLVPFFKMDKYYEVMTQQLMHVCRKSTMKLPVTGKGGRTYQKVVHDPAHVCDDSCAAHSCLADPPGVAMNYKYPEYKDHLRGVNKRKPANAPAHLSIPM